MLRIVAIASTLLCAVGSPTPAQTNPLLLGGAAGTGTAVGAGAAAGGLIARGLIGRGLAGAVGRSASRGLGGSVARGAARYGLDGLEGFDAEEWSEGLRQGQQEISEALRRGRDSIRFDQGPQLNFNSNIRF